MAGTNVARGAMARIICALMGTTALLGISATHAQGKPAGAVKPTLLAQSDAAKTFSIAAQPLVTALRQFADQSGLQLAYATEDLQGLTTRGVSGQLAPEDALKVLLAGSGAAYRFTAANTVTLSRAASPGVTTLEPVTVEAQRESAWGPAPGFVATRSGTGTKTDTPIIGVPQSISVITRDQMDARNVQREGEALRYTAGVFAEPYGGDPRPLFDAPYIRGFDQSTTGVYRDGLREARGVWSAFISEFYGLERIDILRGPSSVLYGQGNPGGIVDKVSKRPPATPLHEIEVQTGSYDRLQGAFDLGGPIDKDGRFLYRLTGLARDANTQYKYDSDHSIPDDREFFAPALTWRPSSDTSLTLHADYLHNLTAGPFTVTLTGARPTHTMLGEPDFNKSELTQKTAGYRFEHRFDDAITVRQNFRYGTVDFDYNNMTGTTLTGGRILGRTATAIDEQMEALTLDNQVQLKGRTGPLAHTILVGLDYQLGAYDTRTRSGAGPTLDILNPIYGQRVNTPGTETVNSHQDRFQVGVYAQDQVKFDEHWVLTMGLRRDRARSDTENRRTRVTAIQDDHGYSYRAGLSYLFDNGLAPYVSYAESFLPTAGADFNANPFKPTTGTQYEVGLKYQPTGLNSFMTLAVFDLTQQNVLTPDPAHPATSFRIQTGEVRSRGAELEAVASLTDGLNLIAALTYLDVEVTESNGADLGKTPPWVAEIMASLYADYTLQNGDLKGFGFGGGARYVGPTYADANNVVKNPGYTLFDAALHYDLANLNSKMAGARLGLNANNLFDKEYFMCTALTNCTWGQGLTLIASLKYRW